MFLSEPSARYGNIKKEIFILILYIREIFTDDVTFKLRLKYWVRIGPRVGRLWSDCSGTQYSIYKRPGKILPFGKCGVQQTQVEIREQCPHTKGQSCNYSS